MDKYQAEELIAKATMFAQKAHMGQERKYTGEPYMMHPMAVAETLMKHFGYKKNPEMIASALLHDVVEDCDVTLEDIQAEFGLRVARLVQGMTKVTNPEEHGNRKARKAIEQERLANEEADVQTIKYADLMHNAISIHKYDKKFWEVFKQEALDLLQVMDKGDRLVRFEAQELFDRLD